MARHTTIAMTKLHTGAIVSGLREWCAEASNSGVITESMAREMAACILRQPAFATTQVPAGYRLLPIEPTIEMIVACGNLPGSMQEMWERALQAAPNECAAG